jgi:hypothetical protein
MILDASEFFKTKYTTSRGQARTKTSGCPDPAPGLITRRRRMPRIKRWFPVNHNINRDPEVWVMRRQIGEKSFSIWMEFLSIADQNESELPGDYDQLIRSVSGTCQSTVAKVTAVYDYAISQGWIKSDPTPHIVKYWKYHKPREPQKSLLGSLPSEPSEPTLPNQTTNTRKEHAATPEGFAEFWVKYPKKKSKGDAEKAWRAAHIPVALLSVILEAIERARGSPDWLKNNGQFIPYPASWLRARGWEDEQVASGASEQWREKLRERLRLREEAENGRRQDHRKPTKSSRGTANG